MYRWHRRERGFTLAELVMVAALLAILAGMAMPVAKFAVKRRKEMELRLALRQMRTAIDEYKRLSDQGMIPVKLGSEGYPPDLETLAEGVQLVGQEIKRKFLRKLPVDPMTREEEWGLKSYQDDFDSTSWGGENVWDVYSLSESIGLDGTEYKDW
ncbi:MAG: general secretion pathway protein GspG [Acidobacteria bacterium]|nr:MAG: general secretion pathway protein GspG [Acidobacteriota bacterium]